MKALCVTQQGNPVAPNVKLLELQDLEPSAGQVLVETHASAMNHLDLWVGRGLPGVDTPWPRTGGSDGCGRVIGVGEGVDSAWIGTQVVLNAAWEQHAPPSPGATPAGRDIHVIGEHSPGTHAQQFVAPVSNVLAIDASIDPLDAAAYALTHLTAWRMLRTRARLAEGESVLITGIGGGVALACLGIASHLGCRTIVTSRHQWKLDRAIELGANHGILDDGNDWSRQIRQLTRGRGVDICADSVGAAVHTACLKSLARAGRFVTCGCTTGPNPPTDLARLFWSQLEILGSTMGNMDEFRQAISLLERGHIAPVIDRVVPFEDGVSAVERIESGEQFGKVLIKWN